MKATCFLLLLFLPVLSVIAQQPKSATPLSNPQSANPQSAIRAVVVGVSDYQDNNIPDLQFAERDAEAFAKWLHSLAGGSVPEDNITLLLGKKATNAAVSTTMFSMLDVCQPGDRFIFYFSGHGDVETKIRSQPGYLLTWDSPAQVYMVGAFRLSDLQDIVSTLSDKQVQVVLITDACHSGKLAGASVGGTQATASALAKQFANEVKIMSCQPNEFSLEGTQWGGGRGVFSYYLMDGLTGLADKNGDGTVNLNEMDRFLGDMVPPETAPQPQTPFTLGDRNAVLAHVDAPTLALLRKAKSEHPMSLTQINPKGLEDEVLAKADSATRQQYVDFKNALAANNLLEPSERCAWDLFQKLSINPQMEPLRLLMRRNLAVALQDEVQQALNALLEADPYEVNQWRNNPQKYALYPTYLERAIALLGEQHPLYKSLTAKKLYFEAYNLHRSIDQSKDLDVRNSVKQSAKEKLLEALTYEPEAAYLYHAIGYLYYCNTPYRTDSMMLYCNKATEFAPNWALPYADMSGEWMWSAAQYEESDRCLRKFLAIKPDSYVALERYAITCLWLNRVEEAKATCMRLMDMRPDIPNAYEIMTWAAFQKQDYETARHFAQKNHEVVGKPFSAGYIDLCRVLYHTKRYRESLAMMDSALLNLSPSNFGLWEEKAHACFENRDYACAREMADSMLKSNVFSVINAITNSFLGKIAFRLGDISAAEKYLATGIEADPTPNDYDPWLFAYMGLVKEKQGKLDEARQWFEQAEDYHYWKSIHPVKIDSKFLYGEFLLRQGQPSQALEKFNFILDNCPNDYRGWYGMALYHAGRKENTLALDNLEKALERYYPIPGPIYEEPAFKMIRKTKRFKEMMDKNFPPGWEKR